MKINKTKILILTLCTMLFALTACESEEEIKQREEKESTETIERLEICTDGRVDENTSVDELVDII